MRTCFIIAAVFFLGAGCSAYQSAEESLDPEIQRMMEIKEADTEPSAYPEAVPE